MREATVQNDFFSQVFRHQCLDFGNGACADFYPAWLDSAEATKLMALLQATCDWQQPEITIAGKRVLIPRLQCWFGDPGAALRYSGQTFPPCAWLPGLVEIKERLTAVCRCPFNSALVNLYRDGSDSVSWHADDEIELGPQPTIASLSLGGERRFSFKPKVTLPAGKPRHLTLAHGDLLVMRGNLQAHWLHALPKTTKPAATRINLTFRQVCRLTVTD